MTISSARTPECRAAEIATGQAPDGGWVAIFQLGYGGQRLTTEGVGKSESEAIADAMEIMALSLRKGNHG